MSHAWATGYTPSRRPRSRVLIVGRDDFAAHVVRLLTCDSTHARTMFEAMGELGTASAAEPIVAAIFSHNSIAAVSTDALAELKRLDPVAELILVEEGKTSRGEAASVPEDNQQTQATRRSFFDATIIGPLSRGHLAGVLDERMIAPPSPPQSQATPGESPSPRADQPPQQAEAHTTAAEPPSPPTIEAAQAPPSDQTSATNSGEESDSDDVITAAAAGDVPLGDTDLIEAMLQDSPHDQRTPTPSPDVPIDRRFAATALRLIAQQTGWEDIQLQIASHGDAAHQSANNVEDSESHVGILHTSHASPEKLEPWAHWLSTWMRMCNEYQRTRRECDIDELSGAWNRRYFFSFLERALDQAKQQRRPVSVMVFDIDDFKIYNDRYGHSAGDEILIETVKLLGSLVRSTDRVCRIGGDEFAVIFSDPHGPREPGSAHPATVEQIARRFQKAVCEMKFPKLGPQAPGVLSISAGLANFPWDGHDPQALLDLADQRAMQSKRSGKNAITFGRTDDCD